MDVVVAGDPLDLDIHLSVAGVALLAYIFYKKFWCSYQQTSKESDEEGAALPHECQCTCTAKCKCWNVRPELFNRLLEESGIEVDILERATNRQLIDFCDKDLIKESDTPDHLEVQIDRVFFDQYLIDKLQKW